MFIILLFLAPFFVDCISEQDLDEMNIEIIRNTLYKAYLEAFYSFCKKIGGTTADSMCEILAVSIFLRVIFLNWVIDLNQHLKPNLWFSSINHQYSFRLLYLISDTVDFSSKLIVVLSSLRSILLGLNWLRTIGPSCTHVVDSSTPMDFLLFLGLMTMNRSKLLPTITR